MHTKSMSELDGTFSKEPDYTGVHCRKCPSEKVVGRVWESNCGGYEDIKFECPDCKHYWWVEGPDA